MTCSYTILLLEAECVRLSRQAELEWTSATNQNGTTARGRKPPRFAPSIARQRGER